MPGAPVTIVASGGLPVRQVASGAPLLTSVASGGLAVTLSDYGTPFVIEGSSAPPEAGAFELGGPYTAEPNAIVYSPNFTGISGEASLLGEHGGCCRYEQWVAGAWTNIGQTPTIAAASIYRVRTRALVPYRAKLTLTATIGGVSDSMVVNTVAEDYPAPAAPVITQASADGANPLTINVDWGDDNLVPPYEGGVVDEVVHRHRVNGGAWVTDDPIPVDLDFVGDHLVDGDPIVWPLYDAATFTAGQTVGRQVGIIREGATAVWSNEVSDEMAAAPAVTATHRAGVLHSFGYSSGTATINDIPLTAGDKVVVHVHTISDAEGTVSGNGGAVTFTKIGESASGTGNRSRAYYADTSGITELDLAITGSGYGKFIEVVTLTGAAAGAPASSNFASISAAGEETHNADGGLNPEANGVCVLSMCGHDIPSGPQYVWTGATEVVEIGDATAEGSAAFKTSSGTATINGANGVPAGPGYGTLTRAATKWNPA